MNIERFLDVINEANDACNDYRRSSARYYRDHGHGVRLDAPKTQEERHIAYAFQYDHTEESVVMGIFDVLGFDSDQRERAYSAARAIRRWYNDTDWLFLPKREMLDALMRYIIG